MKKEFTSTDSYRGDGRNPLSLVEPDIAGHEARQALYRKKRVNIAIVSVILCLVVIASAVFALYTATDLFKTQDDPADLAIDKDDDGLVKTTVVDLASFEAVKNGDYSAFKGINVSEIAELQPFLIGYRLEVIDESVAKIISGMLYGLRPGTTLVEIYSMDGKKVNSFALQVLDAKGKLYYNVVFEYPNADPVVYEVISGRTLNEHNFELPTLPARTGYIPAHWELDGEKFFPTEKIESDITLSVKWNTVAVIFNAVPNLSGQYIEFFEHDLSQYASYGSGDFNFEAASTLPSGLKLEADGRLVGYPTNVIMSGTPAKPQFFSFDVKVIDAVNDTADVVSMNFKAMPRVADIVFSGFNLTYNGGAQTIGVSIQNLAIEDAGQVSVMLDYGANKASVKNADNYTATAVALQGARAHCYTLPEETVAKSFTVQPYTAEIHYYSSNINDQNFNLIYNAKPQTIFAEVVNVFDGDTANITLGYSLSDAERIAVQNGITASVLTIDNPNYIIKNNQPNKVFNIVKAELNVVVHPAIKVYNKGADPVFAFDITGEQSDIDDRSEEDMLRNILKDCIQRAAGENVGAYALTINPATSSDPQLKNYEISVIPSTLMITKRSVGIVASEEIVKTYDGSDSVNMDALMFAEENIVDGTGKLVADADLLSFSAKYEAAGASQNDIPVAITLSGVAKGNYELVGEYTGRIEKFEINTLQGVSASNKVYDNTFTATVNLKAKGVGGVDIPLTGISAAFENSYVGTHNINIFAAQVAGADESNYTVTATALESVALSATIEPREVNLNTAEVAFVKYYDGTTNLPENINYRAILGVIDGTVLEFIGSFASATAGEDKALVLELDPATNPNENYVLAGVYKGTIDKKNVFLNGAVSKEYDASTDLPAIELLGLVEGDEMDVTVSGSYADKNAGENKTVTLNLGGGKAANYNLIFGGKGRIAAKIITVTSDFNKIYDGTTVFNNALTLNGVISGDIVNYDAAYTSKAATLATVTVTLVGLDASNYVLESASFAGEIAKAVITLESFAALNKVYDGTTSAVYASPVFSGKISGDDVAVSGIEPKFDDKNIGTDKLVAIDTTDLFLTGADNANYNIDNSIITTTANITKATVAISGNFDKFFDNTAQFTNALTLNGVVAGDEVGYFAEYASKDAAANIAVNITLNGADSGNYTLATSYTGKISQAVITGITGVAANSKVYDAMTTAIVDVTNIEFTGLLGDDTLTLGVTSATFADANVGVGKVVTLSGLTISGNDNYVLATGLAVTATADITQQDITLSFAAYEQPYNGGTDVVNKGAFSLDGILVQDTGAVNFNLWFTDKNAADEVAIVAELVGTKSANYNLVGSYAGKITPKVITAINGVTVANKIYDTTTDVTTDVDLSGAVFTTIVVGDSLQISSYDAVYDAASAGARTVTFTALTLSNSNYKVGDGFSFDVAATITPKEVTISGNFNKEYDGNDTVVDAITVIDALEAITATAVYSGGANAGTSALAVTLSSTNYFVAQNYSGTILPKEITVITGVTVANKTYDATTDVIALGVGFSGATYAGKLAEDSISVSAYTASYDAANVGARTVTFTAVTLSSGNYFFDGSFIADALITPKGISVERSLLAADHTDKTYDGNAEVKANAFELNGVASGEEVALSGVYDSASAGEGKQITFSISGADAGNYTVMNATAYTGKILKAILTVTGDLDKEYDGTNTLAVDTLLVSGIADDEVTVAAAVFASKNAGTWAITYTLDGADKDNYNAVSANGIISKADLIIDPGEGHEKVYDKTPLSLNIAGMALGLAVSDNISGTIATEGYTVGVHSFIPSVIIIKDGSGVSVAENYNIQINSERAGEITLRDIVVTISASNKVYDGTTVADFIFSLNGLIAGDAVTADYDAQNSGFDSPDIGEDKTVTISGITLTGADAANYNLTNTVAIDIANITSVIIDTITGFTADNKIYDSTNAATINSQNITYYVAGVGILATEDLAITVSGATFDTANQGIGKKVTIPIENLTTVGTGWINYELAPNVAVRYSLSADILANITPRTVYIDTGAASNFDKIYNGTNRVDVDNVAFVTADETTGIAGADTLALSADSHYNTLWVEENISITFLLTNNSEGNYVLASQAISGSILKREVAISDYDTAVYNKTYDGDNTVDGPFPLDNVISGDLLSISGLYTEKNAGTHDITFYLGGGHSSNYYLTTTGKPGTIDKKVLVIANTTDTENKITMEYTGVTTYTGEFEKGRHYSIENSINDEAITIAILSKTLDSPYVTEVSKMTAIFNLTDGNSINDNYLLKVGEGAASKTVNIVFGAFITQKTNYSELTIGAGAESYGLDGSHTAEFTSGITGFSLNFNHGTTPVGLSLQGNIIVYELLTEGAPEDAVEFRGTTLYKSAPVSSVASVYQIGGDPSASPRIFYVANDPTNPICYTPIAHGQPNYEAYMSVGLEFVDSFIVINRP